MTELADTVLTLIRTRADLHWRSKTTAHGEQMLRAVDILSTAAGTDPADVFAVSHKAIASSLKLIMRADDSDGFMGDAIRALLDIHARTAAPAGISPTTLVTWMIKFQFENECDFVTIDPVGYAPALCDKGIARYRAQLEEIRDTLGPVSEFNHSKSALEYNDRRLAVLDRDVDATSGPIVETRRSQRGSRRPQMLSPRSVSTASLSTGPGGRHSWASAFSQSGLPKRGAICWLRTNPMSCSLPVPRSSAGGLRRRRRHSFMPTPATTGRRCATK